MVNSEVMDDEEAGGSSRSSFLLVGLAALCSLFGVAYFVSFIGYVNRSDPQGRHARPKRVGLAGLHFVGGVAGPITFDMGDTNVGIYLTRQGSTWLALEQTCPHQGCPVDWHAGDQRFVCPCHDSQFDSTGNPIAGPAARGLYRHKMQVQAGAVTIEGRV